MHSHQHPISDESNLYKMFVKPGELFCIFVLFIFISCKTTRSGSSENMKMTTERMIVLDKEIVYTAETVFDKEVVIYPEAYLTTKGSGRIVFTKKVNIIGESQVFDENVNVEFRGGTISSLNPTWFGAKGYDDQDDTKALQKTFAIARAYPNSINIEIPIGKFNISQTLELGNELPNGKSINLIGKSMSSSADAGACFQWIGPSSGSILIIRNNCLSRVDGLDFTSLSDHLLKYNIELLPYDYQLTFSNCSFSKCAGSGSANINLNKGNNAQVSEIQFQNCVFRGYTDDNKTWQTESAVIGGLANTKNFVFQSCSFLGYTVSAINIDISDIVRVEHCTFALNEVDITCMLCNMFASSNYSEQSKAFFQNGVSGNPAFTTMNNNYFDGNEKDDYFIRDGSGGLILLNNNFGGNGGNDQVNKIKWDDKILSNIYSVGNFYRNNNQNNYPFVNRNEQIRQGINISSGDKIGLDGEHVTLYKNE